MSSHDELTALVALLQSLPPGASWTDLTEEVAEIGSAREVWNRRTAQLSLLATPSSDSLAKADDDIARWQEEGITVVSVLDQEYPAQLREVFQMPPVLFARGELRSADRGVSVVGSRNADTAATEFAADLAAQLVGEKLSVISGLAAGVDTAAHTAALAAGGRTVAFLGTGINRYYPKENRELQDRIAAEGLVLSQFWPDAPGQRHTFPMRNAVMSGYGRGTVIVAASETSGTRIQARVAVEHGRPVILSGRVIRDTKWARELLGRPSVHQADTPADVIAIVRDITRPLAERIHLQSA